MSRIIPIRAPDLPGSNSRPSCRQCGHIRGYLARYIKSNGHIAIRWICDNCEDYRTASDLPHAILPKDVSVGELPLRVDHSDWDSGLPECAVCDNPSQEFHHWAPSSIFPDWPGALGVYLCTTHHRDWHARMREHGLRWPHELVA